MTDISFTHDEKNISESDLRQSGYVVLNIPRSDVRKGDFTRIDNIFKKLTAIKTDGRGKVIPLFAGYDNVPDEIYAISEIRTYMKKMILRYPHMFYFINQIDGTYKSLFMCLCDLQAESPINSKTVKDAVFDNADISKVRISFSIPNDIKELVIEGTLKYGNAIEENHDVLKTVIENVFRTNMDTSMEKQDVQLSREEMIDIYKKVSITIWNDLVSHGAFLGLPEFLVRDFLKRNSPMLKAISNMSQVVVFIPSEHENKFANLIYITDTKYKRICPDCGSNNIILVKKNINQMDFDNCIFLPHIDNYIKNKILPSSSDYLEQPAIPIDLKVDKWMCPKCLKAKSFNFDKGTYY